MGICKFPGCNRNVKLRRSYCVGHYTQLIRSKFDESKLLPIGLRFIKDPHCIFINPATGIKCNKPHAGRRYCTGHYQQLKNNDWDESKLRPLKSPNDRTGYYQMIMKNYPGLTKEDIHKKHKLLNIVDFGNPGCDKSVGRYKINIKFGGDSKFSKFFISRHLKELVEERRLGHREHVDHMDEDKTNDHVDNLQILTPGENILKYYKSVGKDIDELNTIYKFICPMCGGAIRKRLMHVSSSWKQNRSGPTCSRKCRNILKWCKSLSKGKFKSKNDDIIGRFIDDRSTKEDKDYTQPSLRDINRLRKWRLHFKNKKEYFNKLIKIHYKQEGIRNLSNEEVSLCLKLLSRYNEDLTLYDDFYNLFRNETITWGKDYKLKFLIEALYRFDSENGNSDMSYKLYKYFDL